MRFLLLALALCTTIPAFAQDGVLQVGDPLHDFLLRQQTSGRLDEAFLVHRPLSRYEAARYLSRIDSTVLSTTDRRRLARYRMQRAAPGSRHARAIWSGLYQNGQNLISEGQEDYGIQVDPLLYLTGGWASTSGDGIDRRTWQNTRGARLSGHVGPYLFFESRIEENQRIDAWPAFENRTAPRLGGSKYYADSQTYDYWRAMGVIGIRSRYFEVRAGRDRNRWSDGLGSLFLSDFAPHYDQLQVRTTIGRFQYVNLFTAWTDLASVDRRGDQVLPRKYGALHALAVNLPGRLQLHLYEAVIMAPDYRDGRRQGFDLSYLNPLIFYRAVEIDRGSPDNMQLGAGLSWIPLRGVRAYGQGLLTEFNIDELVSGEGWFGNKWGVMAGVHVVPPWIDGLDVRFEHARIRPFTYSHRHAETTFVSFDDPLGHPAGQNVFDYTLRIGYRPTERLSLALASYHSRRGRNRAEENWGADPRESYTTRLSNHGHFIGQGVRVSEWRAEAHAGYEVLPNMHLDIALRTEHIRDAETGLRGYVNPFLQLRWGMPFQSMRY